MHRSRLTAIGLALTLSLAAVAATVATTSRAAAQSPTQWHNLVLPSPNIGVTPIIWNGQPALVLHGRAGGGAAVARFLPPPPHGPYVPITLSVQAWMAMDSRPCSANAPMNWMAQTIERNVGGFGPMPPSGFALGIGKGGGILQWIDDASGYTRMAGTSYELTYCGSPACARHCVGADAPEWFAVVVSVWML